MLQILKHVLNFTTVNSPIDLNRAIHGNKDENVHKYLQDGSLCLYPSNTRNPNHFIMRVCFYFEVHSNMNKPLVHNCRIKQVKAGKDLFVQYLAL